MYINSFTNCFIAFFKHVNHGSDSGFDIFKWNGIIFRQFIAVAIGICPFIAVFINDIFDFAQDLVECFIIFIKKLSFKVVEVVFAFVFDVFFC